MQNQLSKNSMESIVDPLLKGSQLQKSILRNHTILQG